MLARLKAAFEDGLVLAAKWGTFLFFLLGLAFLVARDYVSVRDNADKGRAAYEFIQGQLAQQSQAAPKK